MFPSKSLESFEEELIENILLAGLIVSVKEYQQARFRMQVSGPSNTSDNKRARVISIQGRTIIVGE